MRARLLGRTAAASDELVRRVLRLDPGNPVGEVLVGDARARVHVWSEPTPVMVKVYRKTMWAAWTHPPGMRSPGAREWDALVGMRERGIPTVEPLCAVEWRTAGFAVGSAIVTRAVPDAVSLVELLGRTLPLRDSRAAARLRRDLLARVGRVVAQCHVAGVLHGRLSLKNVLATPANLSAEPALVLCDPTRAWLGPRTDLRGSRAALAELRTLDRRSWCFFGRTERLRFLAEYLDAFEARAGRAARRTIIAAFFRAIGSPDRARGYESRPGRRARHAGRRRWLSPRLGHRIRAALASRTRWIRPPRYPQALSIDLRTATPDSRIGGQDADRVLGELVEALGPHLTAMRVIGPPGPARDGLLRLAQHAGIPWIGDGWWEPATRADGARACPRPWREAAVDRAGHVRPCIDAPSSLVFGDLAVRSFRDIWAGPEFTAERAAHGDASATDDGGRCARCAPLRSPAAARPDRSAGVAREGGVVVREPAG